VNNKTSVWDLKHDSSLGINFFTGDLRMLYQFEMLYRTDEMEKYLLTYSETKSMRGEAAMAYFIAFV
jgi:hypothetical protein